MSGTNPGTWPDQEPNQMKIRDMIIETHNIPQPPPGWKPKLYTAADLKAARLETVERCLHLLDLYISNVGPLAAKKAIEMFKEEIENEN